MGKLLSIPIVNCYYVINRVVKSKAYDFKNEIIKTFEDAESRYGADLIRKQLRLEGMIVLRRKIRQAMIKMHS